MSGTMGGAEFRDRGDESYNIISSAHKRDRDTPGGASSLVTGSDGGVAFGLKKGLYFLCNNQCAKT